MKALHCFKYFAVFFLLQSAISNAQTIHSKEGAVEYIQTYYSNFQTGYDFGSKYITITDNYKVRLNESLFTLIFDTFDENKISQNQTITINLNEVISIEPSGTDVVEIFDTKTFTTHLR
jgi:hypothetical protein